jgi:flagellar assembly factor FliW
MRLYTKNYGIKEYDESEIITFPKGIPGFENLTKFIIFPIEGNPVFNVMHSIEDLAIGLIVVSPFYVMKEYEFKLEDEYINELKIQKESDVLVVNTVCLNKEMKKMTANLKAPIVININSKIGEQLILDNDKYLIKHPIFKEN